jgi:hypothetical protein
MAYVPPHLRARAASSNANQYVVLHFSVLSTCSNFHPGATAGPILLITNLLERVLTISGLCARAAEAPGHHAAAPALDPVADALPAQPGDLPHLRTVAADEGVAMATALGKTAAM